MDAAFPNLDTYSTCGFDDYLCILWEDYLVTVSGWILGIITIVFLSLEISFERKRQVAAKQELMTLKTATRTAIIPAYPQAKPLAFNPPPLEQPEPKEDYPRDPLPPSPPSRYPPNAFSYLPDGAVLPERKPSYLSEPNPYSSRWSAAAAPSSSYSNRGYED